MAVLAAPVHLDAVCSLAEDGEAGVLENSAERLNKAHGPTLSPGKELHPHPMAAETGNCFQSRGQMSADRAPQQSSLVCPQEVTSVFEA